MGAAGQLSSWHAGKLDTQEQTGSIRHAPTGSTGDAHPNKRRDEME